MKKLNLLLLFTFCCSALVNLSSQTVRDIDGNVYKTVTIGNQTWMAENLRTTKYRNGDGINNITDGPAWATFTSGAWCDYNNDAGFETRYGKLYNWYAVNDSRNMAPAGWHVATKYEYETLYSYFGGVTLAGGPLKETGFQNWNSPNKGATNVSGFTALAGGIRYKQTFMFLGTHCMFWTATSSSEEMAWYGGMYHDGTYGITSDLFDKHSGFYVRCVKDNSQTYSGQTNVQTCEFFPLFGITLGKTTVNELVNMGLNAQKDNSYQFYKVNEVNFWYDNSIVTHMYIVNGIYPLPQPWKACGFDWQLSYNGWKNLFERNGYAIAITKAPQSVLYDGKQSLSAKFTAQKRLNSGVSVQFELDFSYSGKSSVDASETLYSISVKGIDQPNTAQALSSEGTGDCTLFPLYGVMLGKTSEYELAAMGTRATNIDKNTNQPYTYYKVNGMKFWYDNSTADHMYITHSDPFPAQWVNCGFNWSLSYNEWKSLLENKGFIVSVSKYPESKLNDNRQTLSAELIAVKKINSDISVSFTLQFDNGDSNSVDGKNTLYSMWLKYKANSGYTSVQKKPTGSDLFPLFGITLGETTVSELVNMGLNAQKDNTYQFYMANDVNFWYDKSIITHMYLVNGVYVLPQPWINKGFSWSLSFNQWKTLMQNLGYDVSITKTMVSKLYSNKQTLSGELTAVKRINSNVSVSFKFAFDYGDSNTLDGTNTLYSISIKSIPTDSYGSSSNSVRGGCAFFPVFGIMLGKTTESELATMGTRSKNIDSSTKEPYMYYTVNSVNFWYENSLADFMYITHYDVLPKQWEDCGFSWDLSFNEWKSMLESRGFMVSISKTPEVKTYDNRETLSAEMTALLKVNEETTVKFKFKFNYGKDGSTVDSKGSVYSISVDKI